MCHIPQIVRKYECTHADQTPADRRGAAPLIIICCNQNGLDSLGRPQMCPPFQWVMTEAAIAGECPTCKGSMGGKSPGWQWGVWPRAASASSAAVLPALSAYPAGHQARPDKISSPQDGSRSFAHQSFVVGEHSIRDLPEDPPLAKRRPVQSSRDFVIDVWICVLDMSDLAFVEAEIRKPVATWNRTITVDAIAQLTPSSLEEPLSQTSSKHLHSTLSDDYTSTSNLGGSSKRPNYGKTHQMPTSWSSMHSSNMSYFSMNGGFLLDGAPIPSSDPPELGFPSPAATMSAPATAGLARPTAVHTLPLQQRKTSILDQIIDLWCRHFDPTGSYSTGNSRPRRV
ncbi:hypothetical protein CALCODRAFT_505237 [Calocera cornea HHB12733]|uniref:Uncharacterized protein n=1 Tax=Calocera cornea HHB12733 TaxID=1353952 RepID=A0A165K7Z7_9BASI|nr:hypothetical protein CALCODRAFT_505237 [Calocera cornea HHB12733]